MPQARRHKPPAKPKRDGAGLAFAATLAAGMLIGALATVLWQGVVTDDDGLGAGIRRMFERDTVADGAVTDPPIAAHHAPPEQTKPSTPFDFFTVLPGIEVVVPAPPDDAVATATDADTVATGAYMLQAASYQHRGEAERLKASLALHGMVAAIQKVSIQGRGDFYRVRLGPYADFAAMEKAVAQLARAGVTNALRLKVSG